MKPCRKLLVRNKLTQQHPIDLNAGRETELENGHRPYRAGKRPAAKYQGVGVAYNGNVANTYFIESDETLISHAV